MMSESGACDCQRFREQVEALIDRQLDDAEEEVLLDHVRICAECSSMRDGELHLRQLIRKCLGAEGVQVPVALRAKILVSIHKETMVRLRPIRPTSNDSGQNLA